MTCADCGDQRSFPYAGRDGSYTWLCSSCHLKRERPELETVKPSPRRAAARPESLFPLPPKRPR